MSLPSVSRQPLLRMVPADMEDEVLARFFQRSCSLADLAEFTGCTIRAISKWFEREDVQADLQRIARFAQGRTGYLLQESTHLIMQNHEHLMGLLASDKFHYANSTTQARMMETARKAGNDLNKLRQDLDPSRPAPCHDLSSGKVVRERRTDRALAPTDSNSTSRADSTSRDRQGAGELANTHTPAKLTPPAPLPDAHHETKQLDPSPAPRPEPVERSSPIPQFKPAPIPDQHIASFSLDTPVPLHRGPSTPDQLDDLTPARAVPDATPAHDLAGTTEPTNSTASTRSPSPEPRDPSPSSSPTLPLTHSPTPSPSPDPLTTPDPNPPS